MHVSTVLRMVVMCKCVEHYRQCIRSPPPYHDINILKREIEGRHYDGEVYVWPPLSSLGNHV